MAVARIAAAEAPTSRRGFLTWAYLSGLGLVTLQAAIAFLVFFWPRKTGVFGSKVTLGKAGDYPVGSVTYFIEGKFYLVRLPEGFLALYQKCPHLGCVVPWRPDFTWDYQGKPVTGLFRCPCHGSTYLKNGQLIYGPAPRPMDLMKISIDPQGRIVVDTGAITLRAKHEDSQVFKV